MKKIIYIFLLTLISAHVHAQTLEQKIKEMIELSGAGKNFDLVVNRMIKLQKGQYSDINEEFWNRFEQSLQDSVKTQMIEGIIPIYSKYLTESDVEGVIAFYKSEAGQSLINNMPNILNESMSVGQELGRKIGMVITKTLKQDQLNRFDAEYPACDLAKKGRFVSYMNGRETTYIQTKNRQIELYDNTESKYAIDWISPSKYSLKLISSNDPNLDKKTFKTFFVNIFSCDEHGFKYLAKQEGSDLVMEGEMKKETAQ